MSFMTFRLLESILLLSKLVCVLECDVFPQSS